MLGCTWKSNVHITYLSPNILQDAKDDEIMAMIVDVINIATLPKYIVKTSFATMAFKHLRYAMGFSLIFLLLMKCNHVSNILMYK